MSAILKQNSSINKCKKKKMKCFNQHALKWVEVEHYRVSRRFRCK